MQLGPHHALNVPRYSLLRWWRPRHQLLARVQVTGTWQVRHSGLQPLHKRATELSQTFDEFTIAHLPR